MNTETKADSDLIIGYKFLDILGDGTLVGGLGIPLASRYDTAFCANGSRHQAPDENCTCGHHLRWEPDHFYGDAMAQCVAYGKVWIWTEGCRAEKIRIDSIFIRSSVAFLKEKLEAKYGVPVVINDA